MKTSSSKKARKLSSRNYSEDLVSQFGLDLTLLSQTGIIALVSGILAAILDELLGLPMNNLAFTLGGMIGTLNGLTYASLKRCVDRACLGTGILNGWVAYMAWYFTLQIITSDSSLIAGTDWFEATITGIVAGALGVGWFAVAFLLPKRQTR